MSSAVTGAGLTGSRLTPQALARMIDHTFLKPFGTPFGPFTVGQQAGL